MVVADRFKLQGQTLHAGVLGFIHPSTGEYVEYIAPLPEYFKKILEKLRKEVAIETKRIYRYNTERNIRYI